MAVWELLQGSVGFQSPRVSPRKITNLNVAVFQSLPIWDQVFRPSCLEGVGLRDRAFCDQAISHVLATVVASEHARF